MKKILNNPALINDMKDSALFNNSNKEITKSEQPIKRTTDQTNEYLNEQIDDNAMIYPDVNTLDQKIKKEIEQERKRTTKRMSFDIFVDQELSLKELEFKYYKKHNKVISASRIVREALDLFFNSQK